MPEQCERLIDQLVSCRKERGMTQMQLARACGLTQSVVARIESKKTAPQISTIMKIIDVLGYDLTIVPKRKKAIG